MAWTVWLALVGLAAVGFSAVAYGYGLIFQRAGFRWIHTVSLAAGSVALAQLSSGLMAPPQDLPPGVVWAHLLLTISVAAQAVTIFRTRRRRAADALPPPKA